MNRRLAGTLVDHTNNHRTERRIWSASLNERRDLYVYLPPSYDAAKQYPVLLWLHGIIQDEQTFVQDTLHDFDAAMACGRFPPTIIVVPDGNLWQRTSYLAPRTFFLNSNLGNFEDYVIHDVWGFVRANYPIRPERTAHAIGGFSAGGAASYRIAIKYREEFGSVFAISAPLNIRWEDCHGRYFGNFDPNCWGWRSDVRNHEVVGRFYGVVKIRLGSLIKPLYGDGPETLEKLKSENPIEMLDLYGVRPGELAMYVGYGGRDEFNLDAQSESFIYRARERGLSVETGYDRRGRHDLAIAKKFLPQIMEWLGPTLAPYNPDGCVQTPEDAKR
jgi:S-formylglutathione hydrolase FrmB